MPSHIDIAGLELSVWRLTVLSGILLCWILFLIRARRRGWAAGPVLLLLVLALPAGTIGGHLFNVLVPVVFGLGWTTPASGLTVIGSILAVLGFGLVFIKYVMKAEPMPVLDAVAFTFPLSILIGRLGCMLNGCCYGNAAPDWVRGSALSVLALPAGFYAPTSMAGQTFQGAPPDLQVWNLPLLLMLNALLVLTTAETLYRNRERWQLVPGTVMAAACVQYAGGRFLAEFLRKDVLVGSTPFNPWQLAVLALFCASLVWLGFCLARRARQPSPAEEARI